YNPCNCSEDSTYSANYSGTSVEERSGYTSTGTGMSGSVDFYPLGGGSIIGELPWAANPDRTTRNQVLSPPAADVMFDPRGYLRFLRGQREDGRGGWEKYANPAESFRRD